MWRQVLGRGPGRAWTGSKVTRAVSSGDVVTLHKVKLQPRKGFIRYVSLLARAPPPSGVPMTDVSPLYLGEHSDTASRLLFATSSGFK